MTPSMFPNMDDSPRVNSMEKKSTAQAGAPGMCRMASVKTMKARPVPEALCNTRTHGHAATHPRTLPASARGGRACAIHATPGHDMGAQLKEGAVPATTR